MSRVLRQGNAVMRYSIWKTGGFWRYGLDCRTSNAGSSIPGGPFNRREEALEDLLVKAERFFFDLSRFNRGGLVYYSPDDCEKMARDLRSRGLFGFIEPIEEKGEEDEK